MEDVIVVFLGEYTRFIGDSWSRLLENFFWLIVVRQIYELLSAFLPFIKRIANTIFAPFRFLHIWFHIQAVKNLNQNRKKIGRTELRDQINLGLTFRTGIGSNREGSSVNIFSAMNNDLEIREAMYIANAPTLPGFAFLIAIVLAGPLMTASIFPFIHLYFMLGISIALLPSTADTIFIVNTILAKTNISAWYMVFVPMIFFISAGVYTLKYEIIGYYPDFWWLEPAIMGVWSAWVYIILLSFVIYFTNIEHTLSDTHSNFISPKSTEFNTKREYETLERRRTMIHVIEGDDLDLREESGDIA